ncbi:MAG: signal recognition particle protein [Dehalococcoidia bacterium]|nr:signal recognition particle protein [Dehalococcoidia bacterium]
MFEALTEKLNDVFKNLTGKGRLNEKDVDEGLRQVRLALLEADVNFRVARDLVGKIRERSVGSDVLESLTPGQQVIKIVNEELTAVLTGGDHDLAQPSSQPGIVLLVGLQGSGKTTTAAKLASKLGEGGKKVLLVACDLRRPAAIDQLVVLGQQMGVPVYREDTSSTAVKVAKAGVAEAKRTGAAWVIVDTGGRLHIDDELMEELEQVRDAIKPHETLLVVDAMTGQDAVRAAEAFHHRVQLSGLVLTKLDGDSRGGAALSITQVTGIPIKLIGVGERTDALEKFHPDRLASRILGMGDVLSLIEKAQQVVDDKQAKEMERKLRTASFDLEDFLGQFQSLKKMGFTQILDMVPGLSQLRNKSPEQFDEKKIIKFEAIIRSMTPQERHSPEIIDGRRRRRISQGSRTTPQDVNQLLNQFRQANKLMKQMSQAKSPKDLEKLFR